MILREQTLDARIPQTQMVIAYRTRISHRVVNFLGAGEDGVGLFGAGVTGDPEFEVRAACGDVEDDVVGGYGLRSQYLSGGEGGMTNDQAVRMIQGGVREYQDRRRGFCLGCWSSQE